MRPEEACAGRRSETGSNLGIPHSHPLDRNKVRMDDKARAAWSAYDRAIEGME